MNEAKARISINIFRQSRCRLKLGQPERFLWEFAVNCTKHMYDLSPDKIEFNRIECVNVFIYGEKKRNRKNKKVDDDFDINFFPISYEVWWFLPLCFFMRLVFGISISSPLYNGNEKVIDFWSVRESKLFGSSNHLCRSFVVRWSKHWRLILWLHRMFAKWIIITDS